MVQAPETASRSSETSAAKPLAGRHALITGASRGIGAAIARELSRLGADLTLVARDTASLGKTAASLRGSGHVDKLAADVTRDEDVRRLAADVRSLHILINNAGGAESAPFTRTDAALWQRMIDLNLTSVYRVTHALAPARAKSGWGRIVNVASSAGLKGYAYVCA